MPHYEEWRPGAAGQTPLSADRLNEPFHIKSVIYEAADDRLAWTIGRGRTWFGSTLVDWSAGSVVYLVAPQPNTTYYAYLTAAGVVINTQAEPIPGQLPLGGVIVGQSLVDITRFDRRQLIDSQGATALLEFAQYVPRVHDQVAPGAEEVQAYWTLQQAGANAHRYGLTAAGDLVLQTWIGGQWVTVMRLPLAGGTIAVNVDQVDGYHFQLNGGILEYSSDGQNWAPAGLPPNKIRALCRRT